jgi:hypothetical protein
MKNGQPLPFDRLGKLLIAYQSTFSYVAKTPGVTGQSNVLREHELLCSLGLSHITYFKMKIRGWLSPWSNLFFIFLYQLL